MPRQNENWLLKFKDWCEPRSESPHTFIFWAGLFAISATVRKHVWIPKSILGSWNCYPNLYVSFIAPAGLRKTTTMLYADELLHTLGKDILPSAPTLITQAALLQELVESKDGSIYITASELASFISKSKAEMFEFLTDCYDTSKPLKARTVGRGIEEVKSPCLNLLGCATPEWVAANMPADVIGGGFASRMMFVYEEEPRRRQMYYRELNHDILEEYKQSLVNDLAHIGLIEGEFDIEDEAELFMEDMYNTWSREIKTRDPRIKGYYERKHIHVHKVAMLMSLATKDELMLNITDFKAAIKVIELIERKMINVFAHIGKNEYTADIDGIRDFIKIRTTVTRANVYRTFQSNARPEIIESMITALKIMGDIKESIEAGETVYKFIGS